MDNDEKIKEYEAHKTPVPSYDEYWHMISCLNDQTEILNENIMLKELLKQSRIYVKIDTEDYDDRSISKADKDEAKKILAKIEKVLK